VTGGGGGGRGLLNRGPFSHEIPQGLGLDRRLGDVGYVEPHELKCPLGNPPVVRRFPIISLSPYEVITQIGWLSK
jgi:hypothetical protein